MTKLVTLQLALIVQCIHTKSLIAASCTPDDVISYAGKNDIDCSLLKLSCGEGIPFSEPGCGCGCKQTIVKADTPLCPKTPSTVICSAVDVPVMCGEDGGCTYNNQCLATGASYSESECVLVKENKDKNEVEIALACTMEVDSSTEFKSRSDAQCAAMKFFCEKGKQFFSEKNCGCGCESADTGAKVANANADVSEDSPLIEDLPSSAVRSFSCPFW